MREDFKGRRFAIIGTIMALVSICFVVVAAAVVFTPLEGENGCAFKTYTGEEPPTITLEDIDMDSMIIEKVEDPSQYLDDAVPVYFIANGIVHTSTGDVESLVKGYLYPNGFIEVDDYTPLSELAEENRKHPTPPSDPE